MVRHRQLLLERAARTFRPAFRRLGVDIVRYSPAGHPIARRRALFDAYGVDLVLDAGANRGQYARQLRTMGYRGRIVSFEPVSDVYDMLARAAARDRLWTTVNVGLGDIDGSATMHVSDARVFSSLLSRSTQRDYLDPESAPIRDETVQIRRLDSISDEYLADASSPYLKIDTQGFDAQVLDGAGKTIDRYVGVQVELSLVPLYVGENNYQDTIIWLLDRGFELMSVEPGESDPRTGRLYWMDALFFRDVASAARV
jgi:FkbM family methyltransferase